MRRLAPIDLFPDETYGAAVFRLAKAFKSAGLETSEQDARTLASSVGGHGRRSFASWCENIIGSRAAALSDAANRRLSGEPVTRILGSRGFWTFDVEVAPDVLDPRPDTETLVQEVLDRLGDRQKDELRILDLGTGSGVVLAALLLECRLARGVGVDLSTPACALAERNLERAGVSARAQVAKADWREFTQTGFDVVVSNPPYIRTAEIAGLDIEVRGYDPFVALDGGFDGLACYRQIADGLPHWTEPGALVAVEIGHDQEQAVADLFGGRGLRDLRSASDLGGHVRVISGLTTRA